MRCEAVPHDGNQHVQEKDYIMTLLLPCPDPALYIVALADTVKTHVLNFVLGIEENPDAARLPYTSHCCHKKR